MILAGILMEEFNNCGDKKLQKLKKLFKNAKNERNIEMQVETDIITEIAQTLKRRSINVIIYVETFKTMSPVPDLDKRGPRLFHL